MDYKALVENARRSAYGLGQSGMTGTEQTINTLCDAVEALGKALEERTCVDCGKPMVCGGWCVNDPLE